MTEFGAKIGPQAAGAMPTGATSPGATPSGAPSPKHPKTTAPRDPYIRAENEDDDGYDPYSDRRPEPEPLFERDPWG